MDADKLNAFVHGLWKEVSHIEETEDIPRISVEPAVIDMGQIKCVRRCLPPLTVLLRRVRYQRRAQSSVLIRNVGRVSPARAPHRFVMSDLASHRSPWRSDSYPQRLEVQYVSIPDAKKPTP